jgi:hypothetical protein
VNLSLHASRIDINHISLSGFNDLRYYWWSQKFPILECIDEMSLSLIPLMSLTQGGQFKVFIHTQRDFLFCIRYHSILVSIMHQFSFSDFHFPFNITHLAVYQTFFIMTIGAGDELHKFLWKFILVDVIVAWSISLWENDIFLTRNKFNHVCKCCSCILVGLDYGISCNSHNKSIKLILAPKV